MKWSLLTSAGALLAMALAGGQFAPAIRAGDDLDRQLLESLEEPRAEDPTATVVHRLLENTASARERLSEGRIDEDTASLQRQILEDIDELLKQHASPPPADAPPPSEPSGQESLSDDQATAEGAAAGAAGDAGKDGDGRPADDPGAAAQESTERTVPGEETAAERERRLGLATAAWGHLPPKVREQMRSAFSETYLPEYDALLRRYYESLAARRDGRNRAGASAGP